PSLSSRHPVLFSVDILQVSLVYCVRRHDNPFPKMPGKKCLAVFLLYFLVDLSCEMDRQSPQIIWIELPGVIALVLSVLQWSLFRNRIDMIVLVVASAVVLTLQTHQRRQNQSYQYRFLY